jgi:peptidoglycan biosynthesis protein MviN/MurJ (putative lipid II flippase)
LALFAVSLVAQGLVLLFVRAYYASGSTKTPLYSNIISGVLIVVLAYVLVYCHGQFPQFRYFIESLLRVEAVAGTDVLMLPLAYSLGLVFNLVVHWLCFSREFVEFPSMFNRSVRHSFYAAVITGFVAYEMLIILAPIFDQHTLLGIFAQGLCAGLLGIASGVALLFVLGPEELREAWSTLHRRFWRAQAILPPPGETPSA